MLSFGKELLTFSDKKRRGKQNSPLGEDVPVQRRCCNVHVSREAKGPENGLMLSFARDHEVYEASGGSGRRGKDRFERNKSWQAYGVDFQEGRQAALVFVKGGE